MIRGGLLLADARAEPASADVLVRGDRIVALGLGLEAPPGVTVVDARERLVMPGLVNAHTHAHNHLAKGALDGMSLEPWLQHLTSRLVGRTPREIYVGAAIGAIEMLHSGTTCACEMANVLPWPTGPTLDAVAQAYVDVGIRASINAQVLDLSGPHVYPLDEMLAVVRSAVERWHGAAGGRIRFGIGPSVLTGCSEALLEGAIALTRKHNLTLQVHLSETRAEAEAAWRRFGISATARWHELGALGPRTVLAHAVWVDTGEIELIAESGSTVAHNPLSNLKLGAGIAPVLEMRARGCNVALGTDGSASSDNQNMFGPLRLAAILHRAHEPDERRWPGAPDVLEMATLNGARGSGFDDRLGLIAPGAKADLMLLDLHPSYFHPLNSVVNQLVHAEVGSSVRTVFVDGRRVLDEGRVTTVDEGALLAEADEIGQRISRQLAGD